MISSTHTLPLAALALALIQPASAAYDLIVSHAGGSFFDGWTFATGYDNTSQYRIPASKTWYWIADHLMTCSERGRVLEV